MQRLKTPLLLSVLTLGLLLPGVALAQTPAASPGTMPVSDAPAWEVTDVRDIEVDGEPIALSPDGQWLAGIGPGENEICAWDIDTLTPTCAEADEVISTYIGGTTLQWSPDSSAIAFASGDVMRMILGNVYVFEVETGELTQVTDREEGDPFLLGATWAGDGEQVVFTSGIGLDATPTLGIADRAGDSIDTIDLPGSWIGGYLLITPARGAMDGSIYMAIDTDANFGGIWTIAPGESDVEQVLATNTDPVIDSPMIVSTSPDGRYLNVVSMSGFARMMPENTFFLLDTQTGDLLPLDNEDNIQLISFAPDNETGLMAQEIDGMNVLHTIDLASGEVAPVADSPDVGVWLRYIPTWSENDTVFLPGGDGGTLVTLEPAG